ncbi:hypothetical protein ASPTUDRAFT_38949 [Aspergillus tubingensis CBS 134.48]|uniref:Uncharacterized protein n=1 Tax=Aspergillus tubingensis (strain CBS 134.48) TaxID=767770 RepID=A0A1L9NA51_ASPTC|nr:hypothetical protein ASPTUDRAFT_38949 [Aspergillus tubingensis CBS 134.48]
MPTFPGNYKNSFLHHAGAWSYAPIFSVHAGTLRYPRFGRIAGVVAYNKVSTEQSNHCHFTRSNLPTIFPPAATRPAAFAFQSTSQPPR